MMQGSVKVFLFWLTVMGAALAFLLLPAGNASQRLGIRFVAFVALVLFALPTVNEGLTLLRQWL